MLVNSESSVLAFVLLCLLSLSSSQQNRPCPPCILSSCKNTIDEIVLLELLKLLQRQLFRSLEDWEVSSLQFMQRPSTSVAEVPSASALQVLRRLGSIFTLVYAVVQKLNKDSWLELQFSLADNSKLSIVYLLNRT
ncbi:hypothetical protein Tco_1360887 [Tanacetum coccineum]